MINFLFKRSDGTPAADNDQPAPTGAGRGARNDDDVPLTAKEKRLLCRMRMMRGGFHDSDDDMDPEEERMFRRMARHGMMEPDLMLGGSNLHHRNHPPPVPAAALPAPYSSYQIRGEEQKNWRLPELVQPDQDDEAMENQEVMQEEHGVIRTDACLYTLTTTEGENEEQQCHSLLKMPSEIPEALRGRTMGLGQEANTFNLLMVDTSGSMSSFWSNLLMGWNTHVAPLLKGRTKIFAFSQNVRFIRDDDTKLQSRDIDHGSTDLTGALQKMADEVYTCREKYIKLFLVTDGDHNSTKVTPGEVLEMIVAPQCKVVDVYVLGAGNSFPVQYSITLRSLLHNGSSNLPSLFWAKGPNGMDEQMMNIAGCILSGTSNSLKLSQAGFSLPETVSKPTFHLKEWVYFRSRPNTLQDLTMSNGPHSCQLSLLVSPATTNILNDVFRQWNSILIQLHNKREPLPPNAIPLMESLFKAALGQHSSAISIQERLNKKSMATQETEFRTLINSVRDVLTKNKFSNQLDLAEKILSTTVGGGRYEAKVMTLKGHTDADYQNDCQEFLQVLARMKEAINAFEVIPEDCCRVLMTSTLSDLKDPDFPTMMNNLNKFDFLKEFTISGIGVHAPMRDSITINPWSFGVKSILGQPFTVVSQKAMEGYAAINPIGIGERDKEIQLKPDDENTRFNAVVPVFPPKAAPMMEPIVRTRLYAMCTTFAILKNPHMVDFNIHFAALGVTWVRLLYEYPTQPRPEHVTHRIQSIEATAKLYVNRPGYAKYWQMLKDNTAQGLMTESTEQVDGKTLKCESLIKPMFILHLMKQQEAVDTATLSRIIKMLLLEYIGRCLPHHKAGKPIATPYTNFFAEELSSEESRREWGEHNLADLMGDIENNCNYQLKDFYSKERVEKVARVVGRQKLKEVQERFNENIPIAISKGKVERLRNVTGAGDVSWPTLLTFVSELGLPEATVQELFNEQSMVVYTVHSLQYHSSRERLTNELLDYDLALKKAKSSVMEENKSLASGNLLQQVVGHLTNGWMKEYAAAHCDVVQPMTQAQIVAEARERGIDVTEATFADVYHRYRADTGLLGNACQSRACPFFLKPDRSYNQHASVERLNADLFPHAFHKVAYVHRQNSLATAQSNLESGVHRPHRNKNLNALISQQCVRQLADKLDSLQMLYRTGIETV